MKQHTSDVGSGDGGGQDHFDEAATHLAQTREMVFAYSSAEELVVGDVLLPAMSAATMRSPGGRAMVSLLRALDRPETVGNRIEKTRSNETDPPRTDAMNQFSNVPFLVCTLEHPKTGLRVAVIAAATSAPMPPNVSAAE
ncbi:MAG TPA: hypothetical protein VFU43_00110 [Streptosporangiaceae bacterium]|nr:hypothetical protein [Streptosporangiaceae bacterium]